MPENQPCAEQSFGNPTVLKYTRVKTSLFANYSISESGNAFFAFPPIKRPSSGDLSKQLQMLHEVAFRGRMH
jgi:hypothetical protein